MMSRCLNPGRPYPTLDRRPTFVLLQIWLFDGVPLLLFFLQPSIQTASQSTTPLHVPSQLTSAEMCGFWNFWVSVSPQILTKDPLPVSVHHNREILDPRP